MKRHFTLLAFALGLAFTAWPSVSSSKDDVADLRALAYNGDVDALEAQFEAMFQGDAEGASRHRTAMNVFATTHPDVQSAVLAWRRSHPASPHAKLAQAHVLINAAWHIRGDKPSRYTHPDAMRTFQALLNGARDLSLAALEADDSLVPAHDLLLRLGKRVNQPRPTEVTLARLMELAPTYLSLRYGLSASHPGWGGTFDDLVRICEAFAGRVEDVKGYTVDICILDGAYSYFHDKTEIAKRAVKADFDHPMLRKWRAYDAVFTRPKSENAAARATEGLEDAVGLLNVVEAGELLDGYQITFGGDTRIRKRIDRWRAELVAEAFAELEHDPYDLGLIEVIETGWVNQTGAAASLTNADRLELAHRKLAYGYYSEHVWEAPVWLTAAEDPMATDIHAHDAYLINAVVFSDHSGAKLQALKHHFFNLVRVQNMLRSENSRFTDEQINQFKKTAYWTTPETEITCPFVRAYRVHEAFCEASPGDTSCDQGDDIQAAYDVVIDNAYGRSLCPEEMQSPVAELTYAPVPVDLSLPSFPTP